MNDTFVAPVEINTGEFLIRAYMPGDGKALQKATVESYEHLQPWMPWATNDYTWEQAEAVVRSLAAKYLLNQDFTLGIWKEDRLVGGTGFHLRVGALATRNIEIGMWIHGAEAGMGLGTKVLLAMVHWGFSDWGWERIVWRCDVSNYASKRVAEKCGLFLEGTHRQELVGVDGIKRDVHVFAILRSDWLALQ